MRSSLAFCMLLAVQLLTRCNADRAFSVLNLLRDDVMIFHLHDTGEESFLNAIAPDQVLQYEYSGTNFALRFRSNSTSAWLLDEYLDPKHPHLVHVADADDLHELRQYAIDKGRLWLNNVRSEPLKHFVFRESDGSGYNGSLDIVTDRVWFEDDSSSNISLSVTWVSNSPRIVQVEKLLSDWECQVLIQMAEFGQLQPSLVNMHYGKTGKFVTRTSEQMWIELDHSPVIRRISQRIADLMRLDRDSILNVSEAIQLLHYGQGAGYVTGHYDWFWPRKGLVNNRANRYATVFIYLNDVDQGGHTAFFDRNISWIDSNLQCERARVRVQPKRGRAVIFYNMLADGNLDEEAMHAGCVPISSDKYAANFWLWSPRRHYP